MGNPKLDSLAAHKNRLGNNIKANSNAAHAAKPSPVPYGEREVPGVEPGAEASPAPEVQTTYTDAKGNQPLDQTKVRIRVPSKYLFKYTGMKNELDVGGFGGIVFPYTPTISYDVKAEYTSSNPIHSNFAINFYQRSSVGPISISGKFTVEHWFDAAVYISTVHILKSLTKMRSGGVGGDTDSGAPPPICRLDAYGDMMLKNIPVVITSFRVELPDNVDFFTTEAFGITHSVPTISTLAITCLPMYSRAEMQGFSVDNYVKGKYVGKGFI